MNYHVVFSERARRELKKLDHYTAAMIMGWIQKNIEGCSNPRQFGKELKANLSGQWRYRIGNYRLIAEIQDNTILILILHIGHRSEIYNK
ncbi:MAG: type II toxin-antitoxin system RelE/ParE family toxin [Clostridia bacterium]|nr:type II toxin-antitoxin system RelE/ParE family toxin [Clostridia bacterium]MDD3971420.1 type II toxin-antitoxin system RelE/ParE family toxin [Clostridia bacterium]MDD4543869.1 type II toxin-antitoxin system RelE/ParE family toxin [Clostridia bacterium]